MADDIVKAEELERIRAEVDAMARKRLNRPFSNHEEHQYRELLAKEEVLFSEVSICRRHS